MGFLSSLFGVGSRTPETKTVVQAQKLPEEIAPFVKEILGEAQDLYKHQIERGYDPYTGETIAPLTTEEETAMAGLSGLVGTTTPFLEESLGTYRGGAEKFTPEVAQEYMSPYQRAVTDIEKREAERTFERDTMPRFEASGVAAGGLSGLGTRAGVQAAELQRNQNLLLADIEAKGQQQAFQDARMGFESQKAREQQMAANVGRIGPAMFQAGLAEQGALQTVGEQKRDLGQSALDEAYFRFLEEKQFPQQTLSDYSGMVYGSPGAGIPSQTTTTTEMPGAPSTGQQLMGMGISGLNVFGMGGGFNPGGFDASNIWKKEGGPVLSRQEGGPIVYRAIGGKLWNDPEAGDPNLPMAEYKENHNGGISLMMEGDDGEFYTRGGIRQDSLYDPGEVREKEVDVKEVSETITPTNILPSITEPAVAKGPPRNLTPQFSTTRAMNPYAPSLTERLGAIGGNVKPEQNITDTGGGGLTYKELVQRNLVPQTQPQIVQTTLGPRQLDFPGHISIPQPEGGGDSRDPNKSYGTERRKGLSKEQGGTWTYPQYNVDVAKADLERRGDAYPAGSVTTESGPGWGGLTGENVGYFFKHGGGLSQLANGGPVIYRQREGGLQLPNVQRPTLPSGVMANIRQRREAMRNIKDPVQRRIAEREVVTLLGDPSRKIGRPQDIATTTGEGIKAIEGATIGAAGKVAAESEKGISGVEKVLKEAAAARGITVGELQSELARVRKGIPPKGIVGSSAAMKQATPALALTEIFDKTAGGIREHKVSQADRESENIKLLNRLKLEGIDKKSEGEVKVAEKRLTKGETEAGTIWDAKVHKVSNVEKAKLKKVMDKHALDKEIHEWPSKLQDKFMQIVKDEKNLEKLDAEIVKLKREADKLSAEAADKGKGEMKPAKYNALAKTAGVTSGIIFDKETQSISKGGKPIDAQGALDYVDTMIKIVEEQPGSSNWVTALNAAAKKSARKLTNSLDIQPTTIEQTLVLTNPQHREKAIKQIAANTKATEENVRQILGYYGTN